MGLRFRKSVKIGPLRLTASKSGVSASVGVKGARLTRTAAGKTRAAVTAPGTGLSYVTETGGQKRMKKPFYKRWWFYALLALLMIGAFGGKSGQDADAQPTPAPTVEVKAAPVERSAPTEAPADPAPTPTPRVETWIVNTSTGKFHDPKCRAVAKMAEENKLIIEATRGEMINAGYIECDICK